MKIDIVSLKDCYWCVRAVQMVEKSGNKISSYRLLDKSSPDYAEHRRNLFERLESEAMESGLTNEDHPFNIRTFPFVWVNGRFVGGFKELSREIVGHSESL